MLIIFRSMGLVNGKTGTLCRALPSDDFILILNIILSHIDLGTIT